MIYFRLDLQKLDNNSKKYNTIKKNFERAFNKYNRLILNIDSSWNDPNTSAFLELVRDNEKRIKKYLDHFYELQSNVDIFKDEMNSIITKYGYSKNASISYNNSRIQECINYIMDASWYLNDSVQKICSIIYPVPAFTEYKLVEYINKRIQDVNRQIRYIADCVCNFSNSIGNEIYNSQVRNYRMGSCRISLNKPTYKGEIIGLNMRSILKNNKRLTNNINKTNDNSNHKVVIGPDKIDNSKSQNLDNILTTQATENSVNMSRLGKLKDSYGEKNVKGQDVNINMQNNNSQKMDKVSTFETSENSVNISRFGKMKDSYDEENSKGQDVHINIQNNNSQKIDNISTVEASENSINMQKNEKMKDLNSVESVKGQDVHINIQKNDFQKIDNIPTVEASVNSINIKK